MTWRNSTEPRHITKHPTAKRSKKSEVLSGNANEEIVVKKKAPSPNADIGIAVAVPRCVGQLTAAASD